MNDMNRSTLLSKITEYTSIHISEFHENRIKKLNTLKLDTLLKQKNPYLYKAKDLSTPEQVVRSIAMAFLSSAEETMFGDWLEGLAIYIAQEVYGGRKSNAEGIDLEIDREGVHYIVSIKSGPNWSNSSSMAKLKQNFQKAQRIYHTGHNRIPCEAIEGCCYGNKKSGPNDTHTRLCGQQFWEFISGLPSMFTDIIEPIGINAHEKNERYNKDFNRMITKFTREFSNTYCDQEGNIDWNKIVLLGSGAKK